jgi:hypothetical protein
MIMEPEIIAPDGSIRKLHYGSGRQPWDFIVEAGWGSAFAAGNVLKYVRRHAAKNGEDDLKKARWYWEQLRRRVVLEPEPNGYAICYARLRDLLTVGEINLLGQ